MTTLVPLNSNEINQYPERYSTDLGSIDINRTKALETLLGMHPDRSKSELLNDIFSKIDNAMPTKGGQIEVSQEIIDFIETSTGQRQEGKKSKPENVPMPSPSFKKKKDLKNKISYANI